VGIHWTFPLFILLYSLNAWSKADRGWALVICSALLLLYGIILAHEFGHVFAARREGVEAEQVMIWPLGGLAQLGEDRMGMAEVRIAAAGPLVNLGFAVVLLPVLLLAGVELNLSLLSPFDWSGRSASFLPDVLYVLYKTNLAVMLFNLIPAFPIDGGRILRGFLYPRHGMVKSIYLTTSISFVLVGVLIIWGFFSHNFTLVLIAAFVALNAWQVRRQVQGFTAGAGQEQGFAGYDFSAGHTSLGQADSLGQAEEKTSRAERKRALKERKRERRQAREEQEVEMRIDSLLGKISKEGLDSLTRQERTFLEKASRRKR